MLDIDPRMQRTGSGEGVSPKAAATPPTATASAVEGAAEGLTDASGPSEDIPMPEADSGAEPGPEGGADETVGAAGAPAVGELLPPELRPQPVLDFTAFQFAAPSSTTRIGALPNTSPKP